eukprot:TRINITY_DN122428_c0_g1_i1.p1 TRINITY_DN122428_c0_g1~~TRINITY_DN122428_c0_g1_i1.p1  ORF type:complete len:405 (-),score=93.23 TRINITY_DN122428_c0_g1_i1:308-1522(-)
MALSFVAAPDRFLAPLPAADPGELHSVLTSPPLVAASADHAATALPTLGYIGAGALTACAVTVLKRRERRIHRSARTVRLAVDTAAETKAMLAQKEAEYRQRQAARQSSGGTDGVPSLAELQKTFFVGEDGLLQVPPVAKGVRASVYAIFGEDKLQYVGVTRQSQSSLRSQFARRPGLCSHFVVFDVLKPDRALLERVRQAWYEENGGPPRGNNDAEEQKRWDSPLDVRKDFLTADEKEELERMMPAAADTALRDHVLRAEAFQVAAYEAVGCREQLMCDAKLKSKGLLDLDASCPVGTRRPEDGAATTFALTLKRPDGSEIQLDCPPDRTIVEAAEDAGIELPYSCKSGACSACAGKVLKGTVDQSDQGYLDEAQEAAGYVLTCVCYPRSDLVVETDLQGDVA